MTKKMYLIHSVLFWAIGFILMIIGKECGGAAYFISGTLFLVCYEIKSNKVTINYRHIKTKEENEI